MTKPFFTLILLGVTFALFANPRQLPEYEREVKILFPDEAAAKAATLELLPLPEGKIFAFSTRWDDSNPKHARMAALLTKHGFKGTFFLNSAKSDFYQNTLPLLTKGGNSIGNHTLNHPDLSAVIPNEAARQILQNRAEFEARSNQPINSFVLPYCAYKNGSDKNCPLRIGDALLRAGELGSPEYSQSLEKEYGMPEGSWGNSQLFSIDDRNPSAERFDREIARRRDSMKPGEIRHATLGLHTWQDDKGFETLDGIFAKYANRPDWWYCNENEYNAYRYAALHTRIAKRVEGKIAIFTLTGPTPAALGSNTPLWARVTPAAADKQTMVKLPQTRRMPGMIDLVVTPDGKLAASKKFPDLSASMQMDFEAGKAVLTLANHGKQPLTDVSVSFRLPPVVLTDPLVPRRTIDLVAPGKTETVTVEFSGQQKTALYQCGKWFAAAEIDFMSGDQPQRLWVGTAGEFPEVAEAVPRDTAFALGPAAPGTLTPEILAAASNPDESLSGWAPLETAKWYLPGIVVIPKKENQEIAAALTFEAEKPFDNWYLHVGRRNLLGAYLNGKALDIKHLPGRISGPAGKNRLVMLYTTTGGSRQVSVSEGENPEEPVTFINK